MAKKKSSRSDSGSPTRPSTPERRRTVRASTRIAPPPETAIAEPDGNPAIARDTAHDDPHHGDGGITETPTYEEIAAAAYLRYLGRGGQDGYDLDDWIDAERSLKIR